MHLLLDASGLNPTSAAKKARGSQSQLYRYLQGESLEPRSATLEPFAKLFRVPVEAFRNEDMAAQIAQERGLGGPTPSQGQTQSQSGALAFTVVGRGKPPYRVADAARPQDVTLPSADVVGADGGGEEVEIKHYDSGGRMGAAGFEFSEAPPGLIKSWKVDRAWLRQNVNFPFTSASNLCVVTGFGDSMRPVFNPGDPLLVDLGVNEINHEGVFFFRVGNQGFIKSLQRIPNVGIRVISANKEMYEAWTLTPDMDFEILGKVLKIWKGTDF